MNVKLKTMTAVLLAVFLMLPLMSISVFAVKKSIKLNKTSVSIAEGKSTTLKATVSGFEKYTLVWSSEDKTIAAVDKSGKVTAKKEGSTNISVKVKGTSYSAKCKVSVKAASSSSSSNVSAVDFVKNIKIGWNLGNTLDAIGNKTVKSETYWGNPKTTKAMIDTVKKAGFNTIRIPVSWGNHVNSNNVIDADWMARVKEVVNYAKDNNMYIILNTHHEGEWLIPSADKEKAVTAKFTTIWKQIAAEFKDYDEHLIFEGLNEPKTNGSPKEWSGGTDAERKVVNNLNQAFVDTVRASGGNNKTRFLMVTPYAASSDYNAMKALAIPNDKYIIVSIHAYAPYNYALNRNSSVSKLDENGKKDITRNFDNIKSLFLDKGIPVIIGEFGFINKNNEADRATASKYYVAEAKKYGIPCVWWDNGTNCEPSQGEGFGILNRSNLTWYYKKIVDAMMEAVK